MAEIGSRAAEGVEVKVGARLRCPVCGLEVVATKAGPEANVACHAKLEMVQSAPIAR